MGYASSVLATRGEIRKDTNRKRPDRMTKTAGIPHIFLQKRILQRIVIFIETFLNLIKEKHDFQVKIP
jgi:hypothetical protein